MDANDITQTAIGGELSKFMQVFIEGIGWLYLQDDDYTFVGHKTGIKYAFIRDKDNDKVYLVQLDRSD